MRILKVTQSYAPFYEFGGPPVKVEALAKGLARRGHGVTVLTADWGFEERQSGGTTTADSRRSPFGWTNESEGVQSIYLPTWAHWRAVSWNPATRRFCRARLSQYDVVHVYGLYDILGPVVARHCNQRRIPYVVEPIGMFVPIVRSLFLKRVYHRFWGGEMLAGAAAVIATSEQEVEELARGVSASGRDGMERSRIMLRRNGVLAPQELPARGAFREKYGLSDCTWVGLFLGRLAQKKSPDLLLEAFAQLPRELKGCELRLVFAGPDESGMRARLEALAAEHGVTSRVLFTGPLFGEDKWRAYRDADVFVLPSQNENFGNTAMEAAASGTPVVVTENCGVAALLRNVAGTVVTYETREVAAAIERLLSDDELRKRLGAGGKRAAGVLGWEEPTQQMETLYETLLPGRTGAGAVSPIE